MKKLLLVFTVAAFLTACNGSTTNSEATTDSTTVNSAVDTTNATSTTVDTTKATTADTTHAMSTDSTKK